MRINFRKIASALASTAMVSSTVALAAAANFTAPFVQNGNADVAVVYGATADLVAVSEIGTALNTAYASQKGSSGVPEGADFVKLSKPSNNVNLRDVVTTVFGSSVSDDDLSELLADGVYVDDLNDESDYEQRITLGSGLVMQFFSDSDHNDREPTIGINLTSGQMLLNYTLDFTDQPDSAVTGGDLVDLENTNLRFLGRDYFISDVSNATTLDITLLDSANTGVVGEGETVTVNVGSKSYQVSLDYVSVTEAVLVINGQMTNGLSEGQTYKLSDGTYVGVKDIRARDVAGTIGKVEFSLGSGKLELRGGNSVKLNDESINQVTAEIVRGAAGSSGKETLDRINIVWTLDDDEFITPDSDAVLPGFENIKFGMGDFMSVGDDETIYVRDGSSSYIQLEANIKGGAVTIPLLYANSTGEFRGIGKDSGERLVTNNINDLIYNHTRGDRMFVGSWNSSSDSESYLLRFTSFVNDNGVNKTTVQSYDNGAWTDRCTDRRPTDTCTLGSLTLTINSISPHSDRTVNVTHNSGGSFNHLYTEEGLKVFLPFYVANNSALLGSPGSINNSDLNASWGTGPTGHDFDSFRLVFAEEDKDDNVASGSRFNVTINDNSDGEVEAASFEGEHQEISNPDDSNHVLGYVYSDLATKLERTGQSSDQREVKITYAGSESYADVFLTATTGTGSGSTSLGQINVMASELPNSGMQTKNLIIVGGSCVNSAASTVLGLSGPSCGSSWTARTGAGQGSWVIETFANPWSSSKVATLVAGYETDDTKNAATYLSTQSVDTTVSKKYTGTSATSATLVTA